MWVPIADVTDMYLIDTSTNKLVSAYYTFSTTTYTRNTSVTRTRYVEPRLATSYDLDNTYLTKYLNGMTKTQFLDEMEERFHDLLESVAKYGGFYVGRYETGDLGQNIPKVTRMNDDIADSRTTSNYKKDKYNWYSMYEKCKELKGGNTAVETNIIWGIQYDEILKWLIDTKVKTNAEVMNSSESGKLENCATWGNYYDITYTYYDYEGTSKTKSLGYGTNYSNRLPTGITNRNMANNIYDLAGNVYDWTMEAYSSASRSVRGGSFSSGAFYSVSAPSGRNNNGPNYSHYYDGCRATLYIR